MHPRFSRRGKTLGKNTRTRVITRTYYVRILNTCPKLIYCAFPLLFKKQLFANDLCCLVGAHLTLNVLFARYKHTHTSFIFATNVTATNTNTRYCCAISYSTLLLFN